MLRLTTERQRRQWIFWRHMSNFYSNFEQYIASRRVLRYVTLRCVAVPMILMRISIFPPLDDMLSLRYTLRSITFKSNFSQMCRGTYILIMCYQCTRGGCISEWPVTGAWPLNLYVYFCGHVKWRGSVSSRRKYNRSTERTVLKYLKIYT